MKKVQFGVEYYGVDKYCCVSKHPYLQAPLYTYESSKIYNSDLPGCNASPVTFTNLSLEDRRRKTLHLAEVTLIPLRELGEETEEVIVAWTPEMFSERLLVKEMYGLFIPSFLTRQGEQWFFGTEIENSCRFLQNVGNKSKVKKYFITPMEGNVYNEGKEGKKYLTVL